MNFNQGNLENIIMNGLWFLEDNNEAFIDVANVQQCINLNNEQSWAYTTVKTVMDRLVEKGLVSRFKKGKKYLYETKVTRDFLGEEAIKKVARQYFNNNLEVMQKTMSKIASKNYVSA